MIKDYIYKRIKSYIYIHISIFTFAPWVEHNDKGIVRELFSAAKEVLSVSALGHNVQTISAHDGIAGRENLITHTKIVPCDSIRLFAGFIRARENV